MERLKAPTTHKETPWTLPSSLLLVRDETAATEMGAQRGCTAGEDDREGTRWSLDSIGCTPQWRCLVSAEGWLGSSGLSRHPTCRAFGCVCMWECAWCGVVSPRLAYVGLVPMCSAKDSCTYSLSSNPFPGSREPCKKRLNVLVSVCGRVAFAAGNMCRGEKEGEATS